jgi:hypothetical protein
MSPVELERAVKQTLRPYHRATGFLLVAVCFLCGLFGAYFGVESVLILFGTLAIFLAMQFAVRRLLGRTKRDA